MITWLRRMFHVKPDTSPGYLEPYLDWPDDVDDRSVSVECLDDHHLDCFFLDITDCHCFCHDHRRKD